MQTSTTSLGRPLAEGAIAAVLSWLALLGAGAVLVAAARLQAPQLGSGAEVAEVFSAIVVAALGTLGGPVEIGGLELTVLPLGALAVIVFFFVRNLRVARHRLGDIYEARRP